MLDLGNSPSRPLLGSFHGLASSVREISGLELFAAMGTVLKAFFTRGAAAKATGCGRVYSGSINLTTFSGKVTAPLTLD
jgi:hypothetical protein